MPACPVECEAYSSGVVNFLTCLDIEQNFSFLDRHYCNVLLLEIFLVQLSGIKTNSFKVLGAAVVFNLN
jgi:hypothetical protein